MIKMNRIIRLPKAVCRYCLHGKCSYHFWRIMKSGGKPALKSHLCLLWQEKLDSMEEYREAVWRANRFGLTGADHQKAVDHYLSRTKTESLSCPDFRPDSEASSSQCRYYYLQTCLLTFPECPGRCEDYLAPGDQKARL
ncbi:MAG: hypothetical protein JRD68_12280 [Deltaproteobacteria bacterium]|nr:hypothetical protein [Deltaproteobacteria bacterium]